MAERSIEETAAEVLRKQLLGERSVRVDREAEIAELRELVVKLRGYAQVWKRFAERKRQEQLDAEHTWLGEHIRVAEMEVQLAELRTAHRAAVDEVARLRTTLAGAEVLCNALKAQAAGQGRVTAPVTDQVASPAAVSGAAGVADSVTAPVTDTTRISDG